MYKSIFRVPVLLLTLSTLAVSLSAQSDLKGLLSEISKQLTTVNSKKYTFDQRWEFDAAQPNQIRFTLVQSDDKGRSEEEELAFNLADIDDNTIRYQPDKDLILVEMKIKGNQRFVKKWTDGELQNYTNEITLLATDIENARLLQQQLKEAVALSREGIKDRLQLNTFEQMVAWLEKNVKGGQIEDQRFDYVLKQDPQLDTRLQLTLDESDSKNSKQVLYGFNLGDFNTNSVRMMIKGKVPYVELRTDGRNKYVSVVENGVIDDYTGDFEIYTDEVEKARDLETVLRLLIPLAKDKMKAQLPSFGSGTEAMSFLSDAVGNVAVGSDNYQQSMSNACKTTVQINKSDEKGNNEDYIYELNLGDLNSGRTEISVSGETVGVSLETVGKERYIQVTKNGEPQNYSSDLVIITEGIEQARFLAEAFKPAIEQCKTQLGSEAPSDPKAALAYIQQQLVTLDDGKGNSLDQSLTPADGDPCKLEFKQVVNSSKGSQDRLFEVVLSDLDANSLNLKVSGKDIFVQVNTKQREKIIKAYENGEIEPYASELSWQFSKLEPARNSMKALENMIKACAN
ncbi:MAG: hypothetical protein KDC44_11010 [Phaeodactylibacter sp.]|nr:hypothetical protein [Phaeodactylibacter sp.]